jgi:hypothetical protein
MPKEIHVLMGFSHQVIALAMMTEKECEIVENAQFPSLWNSFNSPGSIIQLVFTVMELN